MTWSLKGNIEVCCRPLLFRRCTQLLVFFTQSQSKHATWAGSISILLQNIFTLLLHYFSVIYLPQASCLGQRRMVQPLRCLVSVFLMFPMLTLIDWFFIVANNFWGKDDAGVQPLINRMAGAKQTCDELRIFYGGTLPSMLPSYHTYN